MRRLLPLTVLLAAPALADAPASQPTCQVPQRVSLVAPGDYPPHEWRVEACLQSLIAEPGLPAEEAERRGAYVLKWLAGAPYVNVRVRLDGAAQKALKKSKDASVGSWYLYGVALASMQDRKADPVHVELMGLRSMLARYQARRAAGGRKNKVLEGWAELDDAAMRAMASESVASTEID